jgi:GGDEF domain-containing protein
MKLSIRQIFLNLKIALAILGLGVTFLSIQLVNTAQYSDRLSALKNQHILIKKITATNLDDLDMAAIAINSDLSELQLFAKLSNKQTLLDPIIASGKEQESFSRTLISTSNNFQEATLFWAESMKASRESMYARMISARNLYLVDIDVMIDYQIQLINESISIAKITVLILFFFGLLTFLLYRWRLNQIYSDINKACSVDTNGNESVVTTEEVDFIIRRLSRKMPTNNSNPSLIHVQSGINNEKGLFSMYSSAKRNSKSAGTLFVTLFEIDKHDELAAKLSKEEMANIYKKLAEILSMYEQPLDIIGHLDNNSFVLLMARNTKENALSDAEKIVASIKDSIFPTQQGSIKITLSGGLLLKIPSKSLEAALGDATQIVLKAKETGGNRVAQLRDGADMYR